MYYQIMIWRKLRRNYQELKDDSGDSGNYFDDQRIPDHRLLERVDLTVTQTILTAIGRNYGGSFTRFCP